MFEKPGISRKSNRTALVVKKKKNNRNNKKYFESISDNELDLK